MTTNKLSIDDVDKEYEQLRYRLVRYGDFHPKSAEDCQTLFHLNPHQRQIGAIIADMAILLMEKYRTLAHQYKDSGIEAITARTVKLSNGVSVICKDSTKTSGDIK